MPISLGAWLTICAEICSSIEVIGNRIEKMKRKQKEAWNDPIFYTNDNVIVFDKW